MGWVHRRRDHGGVIFIDLRDREGLVQIVCDPDRAETFAVAENAAQRVRGQRHRRRAAAQGRHGQPEPRVGRDRGARARDHDPEPGADAAVPARRRGPVRDRAPREPRDRPAPAADAEEPDAALSRRDVGAQVLRRAGLHRHRDADALQVHARGRARVPRPVARPPRHVLRAAAVAAAVQADADDGRLRPLLPDLQVLPRRGPARRPPAGVHADRRRDVVPVRARDPRDHGRAGAHDVQGGARASSCRIRSR